MRGGEEIIRSLNEFEAWPREVADMIQFLASDEASFLTRTNIHVDGGTAAVGKGLEWESLE